MRSFIALELSSDIKKELSRLEEELKKIDLDVKWIKPDNIHLTLKFLGEIDEAKVSQIKEALANISSGNKSFEISLFKLGTFPNMNHPRVVWVGIDKGCSEVESLAGQVEERLEKIGFAKEERLFSAHLTIGRVKSGKNKLGLKEKILALDVESKSCDIKDIVLFQSKLTPQGAIHTSLGRFGLT